MQPGSLKLILFKGHLNTRSRYCISTLSTATVLLSFPRWVHLFHSGYLILYICVLYDTWHWLGCALSRFVWLFLSLCSCFVECLVSFSWLISVWKICFLLMTSGLVWCRCWTMNMYWLFQHIFLMHIQRYFLRSIKTAICIYRFCIVSVSSLAVFLSLLS